ncbi:MAG: hypothetical protein MUE70_08930 [Desulfobacterales bacterium]|nr:hypothetical protein [Desulfobacterales bacterium]
MKIVCAFIIMCSLIANPVTGEELKRLSLDDLSGVGLTIQPDATVKAEGKGSIKITTLWPTVVCLGEVSVLNVENAKLVYSAKVKSDLDGSAFLEMWVSVAGGQYFSKGMNDVVSQKTDWKTIQTPFMFEKGQNPEKVALNLVINGKGTVWIDDIVLSKEPLK